MASIRLFGRGRNAAAAAGGSALDAARVAELLDGLTTASMSTTWRCRHGAGVSIGEGAVDFAAGRSRSTVIRGKYTFEYVRSGSSAYRTAVTDVGVGAAASSSARAAADAEADTDDEDDDEAEVVAQEEHSEAAELEASDDFDDVDDDGVDEDDDAEDEELDAETDAEAEAEDGEDGEDGEDEGVDEEDGAVVAQPSAAVAATSVASASVASVTSASAGSAWEKFSEHDACGVHAYAEPAVLAAGVRAVGAVQPREAQEIDGVKLSAYSVTLKPKPADPNRLLARLARQLRDHGANTVVVTAFVDESQSGADEVDGLEESGAQSGEGSRPGGAGEGGARIVRLRIELPHWTPADDPTADHSVSVDLFEFGEPVDVQVPEGAGRRTARSCADLALF